MNSVSFIIELLMTNVLFSLILCAGLVFLNKDREDFKNELLLYALGLGPACTALLLYYLLLIFPAHSYNFYILVIFGFYGTLLGLFRKEASDIIRNILNGIVIKRKRIYAVTAVILFFICAYSVILKRPLSGNDVLEYGAMGKTFFSLKRIELKDVTVNPDTGFYRPSQHAPGFPLLLTWGMMINNVFNMKNDIYFKSIPFYYGFLIAAVMVFWLSKKSKWLAALGVLAALSGGAVFYAVTLFHVDTFRVFFLTVSWIFLAHAIEKRDVTFYAFLGIFMGLSAFAHAIGAVIGLLTLLTFFIFIKGGIVYRVKAALFVTAVTLALGMSHYVINGLWGTGWAFKI